MHEGVYVGRLLSGNYVGFDIAQVPLATPDVLQPPKKKKKNLMLVRFPSGIAFVLSCRARTAT
jgi:hypothetical protein